MYLTGRVNMKSVEVTIQNLIGSGMDPKTENNPYLGFTYTSFQERATKVGGLVGRWYSWWRRQEAPWCNSTAAAARTCTCDSPRTRCCRTVRLPVLRHIPQISHGNTARHALEYGDEVLAKICGLIASDEGRHEIAYQRIMEHLFEKVGCSFFVCF